MAETVEGYKFDENGKPQKLSKEELEKFLKRLQKGVMYIPQFRRKGG